MNGFDTRPIKGLGNEPMVLWGSFETNGSSDPTDLRYSRGFNFTAELTDTGEVTITVPSGCILPAQPGSIVVSAQFATLATDWFEVGVVGESTLNASTRQFVIQMHRSGTAREPAATNGNRVNFAIFFNNTTGA